MTTTSTTPLRVRSYASDALHESSGTPQWTLFVRQQRLPSDDNDSDVVFVLTAVVPTSDAHCAVYEQRLDRDAMEQHIDELGIEVQAPAFVDLLVKTLALRKSVDIAIDADDDTAVRVLLTYKFSDTMSRKGHVVLKCVSKEVPRAVAALLHDVHAVQNESVLTESQKLQKQTASASAAMQPKKTNASSSLSLSLSQESNQSTDGDAAVAPTSAASMNPLLLKRRHVPTGTVRRKGPRGAKLAKLE